MASTEMDSLQKKIHDKDEQLTSLLQAKEEERRSWYKGMKEEVEDGARCEIYTSDIRARLEETSDIKMKAEEEPKDLQSRVTEMEHKEMVVDNVGNLHTCIS